MSAPARLVLLGLGLLTSGATALVGIQPNDEGLMLQAAARIASGEVPYRDFWWFYPPGQPYLLGGLHELFGPSLVTWRVVRVLADATVAVLAYALARRHAGPAPALATWLVSLLAMAYPSGPHPFPIALALSVGALLTFERRPAVAGALTGACAAWRLEFAVALAAGIALGLLLRRTPRDALRFSAIAALTSVVLYAPVVAASGVRPTFDLLIDYPLTDFRDYQSLPFPLAYDGPLNTASIGGFVSDSVEPLLLHFLPLTLVIGLAGAGIALAHRLREPLPAATAVFSLAMLAYLLTRADLFHTAPLAVLVGVLGAWALAGAPAGAPSARRLGAGVVAVSLLFAAVEGLDRRWLVLREDTVALDLQAADGVRVERRQARALEGAVAAVERVVAPGEFIYVATRRADLVTAGNPLLYVLANRPNPTRYDIAAPGVLTSAPVQREIVADLIRTRPRVVIRDSDPLTAAPEPNAAGRSSGVRLLDDYLERAYAPTADSGTLRVLNLRR